LHPGVEKFDELDAKVIENGSLNEKHLLNKLEDIIRSSPVPFYRE